MIIAFKITPSSVAMLYLSINPSAPASFHFSAHSSNNKLADIPITAES